MIRYYVAEALKSTEAENESYRAKLCLIEALERLDEMLGEKGNADGV